MLLKLYQDVVMTIGSKLQYIFSLFTDKLFFINTWLSALACKLSAAYRESQLTLRVKTVLSLLFVGFVAAPMSASAALPAEVTTAIGDAATDVATAGALVLGVFILIKVFKWIGRTF